MSPIFDSKNVEFMFAVLRTDQFDSVQQFINTLTNSSLINESIASSKEEDLIVKSELESSRQDCGNRQST
ncbi:hypothetical protein PHOSAC3_90302 [Mesotoga infera]|jgi:hypothetical protein|nr:hypothetical protein PHOSAC3_90302 [Mesotoga infera]